LNKLLILIITFLTWCCAFSVNGQSSSFTFQSSTGTFCNPATINFTQTYTGNPIGFTWTFGNGQSSNDINPSVIYTTPGTYTVQLVTVFNDQAIQRSQTITINQSITGSLTADRNYICTPGNILFTAGTSGNIRSYDWSFGDGSSNIITTTSPINHSYTTFGNYNVSVKATDVSGCFVTSTTNIIVQRPPVTGTVSPIKGCIPINVNFSANATVPTGGNVTSYMYDFGDGSPTSNIASHTYTTVGSFTPSVTITTNEGCTNTYTYPKVAFGTPPTNHIAYSSKSVYCGSETAVFISKANNANSWKWDYGDGNTQIINDTVTTHKYATLGIKTITVTPFFNGCAGSPKSFSINIIGVIAGYTYANSCSNKNTFLFTNTSQGNLSTILWNFGDGSPTTSLANPIHTFPTSGSFLATLTVTDNITGCSDILSTTMFTATPTALNPDNYICRNSNTTFSIQNNYSNNAASYNWSVVGLPAFLNTTSTYGPAASVFGNFTNNQVVIYNGSQYCNDTLLLNHPILVRGPKLNFTTSPKVCANTSYSFLNTSSSFVVTDTILFTYWNYGITPANDTTFQPSTVKFPSSGIYNIELFSKDNNGCTDSLIKQVNVKPVPFLRIFPRNDTICEGKTASFIAYHSDTLSWSPSATLSCATCDTVVARPTSSTLYFATVNNSFNCPTIDSTLITVYSPFNAKALVNPIYLCDKDSVKLLVVPPGKKIIWSPSSNISNTIIYNPFVSPPTNTTYTATLTDSVGCFTDTASVTIIIKSLPQVNAGPDKTYPYNAIFTISPVYSANVASYSWMPNSSLSCITCPITSGIALTSQQYTIKAISDSGCVSKDNITIFIECKYANLLMPSAFTPNRDGLNDIYYPMTRGIKTVKRFVIYNRYGQQLFERKNFVPNDKSFGWDGKLNGIDQSPGSYVYMLETICDLGEIVTKKDSFLLLR
jgi:gliding motility-associated-like protein